MDLGEAGIGQCCAAFIGSPDGGAVRSLGIGGQKEYVAISAGAQDHGVRHVRLDLSADQVARDNAASFAVDHDQIEHLGSRKHGDLAHPDLAFHGLIGAQQELLPGLPTRIKGP